MSSLTVTIVEHSKSFLIRLEHDGASITLDRAEAFDLHEKLSEKIGGMQTLERIKNGEQPDLRQEEMLSPA